MPQSLLGLFRRCSGDRGRLGAGLWRRRGCSPLTGRGCRSVHAGRLHQFRRRSGNRGRGAGLWRRRGCSPLTGRGCCSVDAGRRRRHAALSRPTLPRQFRRRSGDRGRAA